MNMQTVKLTYFKKSGKYYSEGEYESEVPEYHDWQIYEEVRKFQTDGKLPGLVDGCVEFDILVGGETVVPALIKA